MKAFKMIGLALMGTLTGASFSACTSENEEVFGQDTEIRLTSEITPSRVTSLDYQSTQIVANQQVGITITGAKADHKNVAWTAEADGALTNTGSTLYYGTGTATITAYHPHNSAWTGTSHTFSVNTDQSTDAGYLGSDLLWATASSGKTANAVLLTFTHKLAKINVTLQSTDITDLSGATISICGTNIATNFNPSTGALPAATANVQEIKAGVTTNEAKTASAIIVPQTVAAGTPFIKITLGEKVFYHKLSAEKTFVSGKSYSYTLNVKENSVEITATENITDWSNENIVGDADEDATPYLTFTADAEQTLTMSKAVATLEYSVNNGTWRTLGTTPVTFGSTNGNLHLRGQNSYGTATDADDYVQILFDNEVDVSCSGDIRTLIDYKNYATASTENARFCGLFEGCQSLTTAPQLPAKTLATNCYQFMFNQCYKLTVAPELPATTLATDCYTEMFRECINLTVAPELPATTLAPYCYSSMFQECYNLTTAPQLPATTLAEYCYAWMFYWCDKLNSITMLATNISAEGCLENWVEGSSETGTFIKASAMNSLPTGNSGIPTGWAVENYTN